MAATSSKGVTIYISKSTATTADKTITAATAAKPSVLTLSDITGVTAGDIVKVTGTGISKLDGKLFTVGTIVTASKTLVLVGSDLTSVTIPTLTASAKVTVYKASDNVSLCLSTLGINSEVPGTVSVGTFCDPTASISAVITQPGTMTLGGYIDSADLGYAELLTAESDGKARILDIKLPGTLGDIVAECTISAVAFDVPIDGAMAFTATAALTMKAAHRY